MEVKSSAVTQLLEFDIPYYREAIALVVFVTIVLGLVRKFLNFHTNEILFRRTKNIESTLSKLDKDGDDYELFKELMVQELFQANTRLSLSKQERRQIEEWTCRRMIPMSYIKKAWPNMALIDSRLTPKIENIDIVYSIFVFLSVLILTAFLFLMIWVIALNLETATLLTYLQTLIVLMLTVVTMKQLEPIFYARKIRWRLEQTELLESESGDEE